MGTKTLPLPESSRIADALFTKVQRRVLGVLFGNPTRSYCLNELIHLAASGTGAVQRETRRLVDAGLVTLARVGNMTRYQANPDSPVFHELTALVRKTSGMVDVLRATLGAHADHIDAAFVFGSMAKQTDKARSDIDVLVVSDALEYGDLFAAVEPAAKSLGRPVNPTIYSRSELSEKLRAGNHFVSRVMEQPKLWIIGNERDLTP
jgi:predicted nucleotidyltransferase